MGRKSEGRVVDVDDVVLEADDAIDGYFCGCRRSIYYTVLLFFINLTLFADQNLLAPVLTPVARDFGWVLTDEVTGEVLTAYDEQTETFLPVPDGEKRDLFLVGYTTLAFFMIGGVTSLVVGYFADTVNRRNALAVVVVIGETSCLMTILVQDFWSLLVTRSITGVAIGGAVPLMYSLFGDLFTVEYRGKAIAAAGTAIGAGGGLGQIMAGIVAGKDGSGWRIPFVIVAVPAYFLVVLMIFTVKEPPRGHKEEANLDKDGNLIADYTERISWAKVKEMFRNKTIWLVFLQGIPASLPWGVIQGIFNDFLIEQKYIPRAESGLVTLAFGVGGMIGAILGGVMADKLAHRMRMIPIIMGSTTALGAVPMIILIRLPPKSLLFYMAVSIPSGVIIGVTGSAIKVVLTNVALPEIRGTAFSVFNLFDDVGKGGGTFVVTAIAVALGREDGLTVAMFGWVLGGMFHLIMYFTVENDYRDCQAAVKEGVDKAKALQSAA